MRSERRDSRRSHLWRVVALCALAGALVMAAVVPSSAHGEAVEVVVEALVRVSDLGRVEYGILLVYEDGDPVGDAEVVLSADAAGVAAAVAVETVPGVYIGELLFPDEGVWGVSVAFESAAAAGSLAFTQEVTAASVLDRPVVMADSLDPLRVGSSVVDQSGILGRESEQTSPTSSSPIAIVVEAFIRSELDSLAIEYAISLTSREGTAVREATVVVEATSEEGNAVTLVMTESVPGLYRGGIQFPAADRWTVTLAVAGQERFRIDFIENLPWPHYTTEAGKPKVKFDSLFPDRAGTIVAEEDSIYFRAEGGSAASPAEVPGEESSGAVSVAPDVVLDLESPSSELRLDIALRLTHVGALVFWAACVGLLLLGKRHRLLPLLTIVGAVATVASGALLMLWGAPLRFPGLIRWNELGRRSYGGSYQSAFILKMVFVVLALGASLWLFLRRRIRASILALAAMAGAVMAVTAMTQFHLFSHL